MKKTKFYSNRNKSILMSEVKNGNKKAEMALLEEMQRLESRIKSLEYGLELLLDYAENTNFEPKEVKI